MGEVSNRPVGVVNVFQSERKLKVPNSYVGFASFETGVVEIENPIL